MIHSLKQPVMWLKQLVGRHADPVNNCELYQDKSAGSCTHVDGMLCDFPRCSILADYRQQEEGMTIAGSGATELGKLIREQRSQRQPFPYA